MKKCIISLLLIIALISSLVGCSISSDEQKDDSQQTDEQKDNTQETEEIVEMPSQVDDDELLPSDKFIPLDFEDGSIPKYVTGSDSTIKVVDHEGYGKGLEVVYSVAEFPSLKLRAEMPWDFGENSALSFVATNPTDDPITFHLRIDDDEEADGSIHSTVSIINIKANSTERYYFSFSENVLDYGMRNLPLVDAGEILGYGWGETSLDESNIVEFQLWRMYTDAESTLVFDDFEIIGDPNSDMSYMDNLVDKYGQLTRKDWEDKIKADADLLEDKAEEAIELVKDAPLNTSKYGGWLNGPKLEATGKFRVEKYEDQWTMVDPEGYLFFSTGLDIARLEDMNTWISGRENMFEDIPDREGEFKDHFSYTTYVARAPLGLSEGWLFNHYTSNLQVKYGSDYEMAWRDISVDRFKNWGFSSIGNWSDPILFHGKGEETEIAYVANGWSNGTHASIPSGNQFWAPIADPFDPEYINSVDTMIDDQILAYDVQSDPWCLGVYIDNEIAWGNPSDVNSKYALVSSTLAMDVSNDSSYAKKDFVAYLKDKYPTIGELNTAWGITIKTYEAFEAGFTPEGITGSMEQDYSTMLFMLADKYFSIVDAALEEKLPDVLYLGSRFAEWGTSLEVQQAAAKYVDVVSFNVYKEDVIGENWMNLEELDMPIIIGEFHFGSSDRSMFGGGLVYAKDQENRGEMYVKYIDSVLKNPYFVGAHWFQYYDQPLLGRGWDGENYNVGFVDVADIPYEALIKSAKDIHSKVYDIKFNGLDISD